MKELIREIAISVIVAVILYVLRMILKFIMQEPEKINGASPSKTRNQFLVSMIALIASLLCHSINNDNIKIFCVIITVYSLLVVWGAFESIYGLINTDNNKHSDNSANDNK